MNKQKTTKLILITLAILGLILAISINPMSQSNSYHQFSEKRTIFKITNCYNVISNIPFFMIGIIGLFKLRYISKISYISKNRLSYFFFYFGILFVSLGSAFYHLTPTNDRLIWDRIPMTFAFMSLFSIILSEFINDNLGKKLLIPLLLTGIGSVIYWYLTEKMNFGNLNYYALVQFYPMLAIPLILVTFKSTLTKSKAYWYLFILYFLAKISEHFDKEIFENLKIVSGHTMKHLFTSFGLFYVMYFFDKRKINKINA